MPVQIDTTAVINAIKLTQQNSHPSAPAAGSELLYAISGSNNGGLFLKDSGGRQIGPFVTGTGNFTLIQHQEAITGSAPSFVFNVSGTSFTHLLLLWGCRGTDVANQNLQMQFNGDTGANYDWRYWTNDGTSTGVGATVGLMGIVVASGTTAGIIDTGKVTIQNYLNSHWHKTWNVEMINPGANQVVFFGGRWASTAAIFSIKIFPAAGSFAQFSYADLYGIT